MAEILAEGRDFASRLILDDHPIARGAGIAASATVAVGDQVGVGSLVAGDFALGEERLAGCWAGRNRGHAVEFTTIADLARAETPGPSRAGSPCAACARASG